MNSITEFEKGGGADCRVAMSAAKWPPKPPDLQNDLLANNNFN